MAAATERGRRRRGENARVEIGKQLFGLWARGYWLIETKKNNKKTEEKKNVMKLVAGVYRTAQCAVRVFNCLRYFLLTIEVKLS